jgi:hypothetical protein
MISVTPLSDTEFDVESFVSNLKPKDSFVGEFHSNMKGLYHVESITREGYQLIWYSEMYKEFASCNKPLTTKEMVAWLRRALAIYRVEVTEIKVKQIGPTMRSLARPGLID